MGTVANAAETPLSATETLDYPPYPDRQEPTPVEWKPDISVVPLSAAVGSEVKVKGEGFPPDQDLEVGIGRVNSEYDIVDTGDTDSDGSFETQMTIPDFVEPEDDWVIVVTADDGRIKAFSEVLEIRE